MMAKQNPLVRGLVVVPVPQALSRRGPAVVEAHHFRGNELGVKAESDEKKTGRRAKNPDAVDVLAAVKRDRAQAVGAGHGKQRHDPDGFSIFHFFEYRAWDVE